jgi:hypothetical protein
VIARTSERSRSLNCRSWTSSTVCPSRTKRLRTAHNRSTPGGIRLSLYPRAALRWR